MNEFRYSVGQARGSLAEVETPIEIARSLGYLSIEVACGLLTATEEAGRILTGLRAWSEKDSTE
ncbi:MAG: four helix bundle protein [Terriglobales bacterium]